MQTAQAEIDTTPVATRASNRVLLIQVSRGFPSTTTTTTGPPSTMPFLCCGSTTSDDQIDPQAGK
jgi:hypothetical protein